MGTTTDFSEVLGIEMTTVSAAVPETGAEGFLVVVGVCSRPEAEDSSSSVPEVSDKAGEADEGDS
jgi:hypothetical protein